MKRILAAGAIAACAIGGGVSPALAAGNSGVVGSFHVNDNGQGCWTGGALLADGTATSNGGECSFFIAPGVHEQLSFVSKTWVNNGDGTATLCATVAPTHAGSDPAGIAPDLGCTPPIPINAGPVKIDGTVYMVNLKG